MLPIFTLPLDFKGGLHIFSLVFKKEEYSCKVMWTVATLAKYFY